MLEVMNVTVIALLGCFPSSPHTPPCNYNGLSSDAVYNFGSLPGVFWPRSTGLFKASRAFVFFISSLHYAGLLCLPLTNTVRPIRRKSFQFTVASVMILSGVRSWIIQSKL